MAAAKKHCHASVPFSSSAINTVFLHTSRQGGRCENRNGWEVGVGGGGPRGARFSGRSGRVM